MDSAAVKSHDRYLRAVHNFDYIAAFILHCSVYSPFIYAKVFVLTINNKSAREYLILVIFRSSSTI